MTFLLLLVLTVLGLHATLKQFVHYYHHHHLGDRSQCDKRTESVVNLVRVHLEVIIISVLFLFLLGLDDFE